jgi:hypothetical protein
MISSKVQGSAMIRKNPLVVNHIIELLTKDKERSDVSMETHLTELSHLRDQAVDTGQVAAAISAEVSRGRAAGLYIDRKEVTVSKVENMTTEELFTRLQEIMNKSNMKVIEHEERKEHIPVLEAKPVKGSLAKS